MGMRSESREVRDFDSVILRGHGDITLEQGDHEALVIEADEDLLPKISTEVENGRLVMGLRHWWDHWQHPLSPIHYRVVMREVRKVSISGSGTLEAGGIQGNDLELEISGSGKMTAGPLTVRELEVGISGSGRANLAGQAERHEVRISGSGTIETGELACQQAEVHISGSGSVTVRAAQTLDVHISGSGTVKYFGQPRISQHISGAGSIQALQE